MHIERQLDPAGAGDLIVLKLRGKIAPANEDEAIDLGSLYGPDVFGRTVALDLRDADFLASSGVNWILAQRRSFEAAGGRLAICCGEGMVLDVLRLIRLDKVIPISPSLEAIASEDLA